MVALAQVAENGPQSIAARGGRTFAEELTRAYGVFHDEAKEVSLEYSPKTVNIDGWKATAIAWKRLFSLVAILQCFLHGWLKIRDRCKHLDGKFEEIGRRVWQAYRAASPRSLGQQQRRLREWPEKELSGAVRKAVEALCRKGWLWDKALNHPEGHRTSNMLDRVMRAMNRYPLSKSFMQSNPLRAD